MWGNQNDKIIAVIDTGVLIFCPNLMVFKVLACCSSFASGIGRAQEISSSRNDKLSSKLQAQ